MLKKVMLLYTPIALYFALTGCGWYVIDDFMRAKINGYITSIMEESALIKDSGMLFLASFAGSIFLFVANIMLSKQFGPEGFGNFKTVLSLFLFLPALIEFGAGATLTKYIAEGNTGIIKWFLKLRVVSYAVVEIFAHGFRNVVSLALVISAFSTSYFGRCGIK